jgi:hypothetical protein
MTHGVTDLLRQSDLKTSLRFWSNSRVSPNYSLTHSLRAVLHFPFLSYSDKFSEFISRQHQLLGASMITFSIVDQKNDG